jgi:TRAP-type C4-dicarboxylate transport system substrate-binding protein
MQKFFKNGHEDIQDIFIEAADSATRYQWLLAQQEDEQILAKINPLENEIIDLTDDQSEEFQKTRSTNIC